MRLYIKTCSNLEILSTEEQRTFCKMFVNPALWSTVEFLRGDNMEVMVKRVEEAFDRLQPVFSRKVKFLELMTIKGESYVEWAARINQVSELADLDGIKSQNLKLMKFCQGLKQSDRLYDKLMEIDPKSWARAQEIIRKHAQSQAFKADLVESTPKNQGHVVMALSGGSGNPTPRPLSQSPGKQRKKYYTNTRWRDRAKGVGEALSSGRSSREPRNSRICWNCDEITNNHYTNTCQKPQKNKEDPSRSVTPYPNRGRSSSRERGGASQGSENAQGILWKGAFVGKDGRGGIAGRRGSGGK